MKTRLRINPRRRIEFIDLLEEVSERETQKSSQEELVHHSSLEQLSLRQRFDNKDVLGVVSLVERARRDFCNSKTKLTNLFGSGTTS